MGRVHRARRARNEGGRSALSLVLLLLGMSLVSLALPAASASPSSEDLHLQRGVLPLAGVTYDLNEAIFPVVNVSNDRFTASDPRQIKAEICAGDHTQASACPSSGSTTGVVQMNGLEGYNSVDVTFSSMFFMATEDGTHTIFFYFTQTDIDATDDFLVYTFEIASPLRDVSVNGHDFDSDEIYNTGEVIPTQIDIGARSWLAGEPITTGWSIYKNDATAASASDCVDWEFNYTGLMDEQGNLLHEDDNITHLEGSTTSHYAPYGLDVTLGDQNDFDVIVDLSASGLVEGESTSLRFVHMLNGTFVAEYWHNASADVTGVVETTAYLPAAEGENCIYATMEMDEILISTASHQVDGFSGSFTSRWVELPNITAPSPGEWEVRAGMIYALSDPNGHNDMVSWPLIVNDDVDVRINQVIPARGGVIYEEFQGVYLTKYPYGEDVIKVMAENVGNITVTGDLSVNLVDAISLNHAAGPYTCTLTMEAGESGDCVFNHTMTGPFILNASWEPSVTAQDVNPADNWFEDNIIVNISSVAPAVSNPIANSVFLSGEEFLLVASHSPHAVMPLNFTWKINYQETIGYGQVASASLPMGDWLLTVYVTDALGNMEIATTPVRILNKVDFTEAPYVHSGSSISTVTMDFNFEGPWLPELGRIYPAARNAGKSPLIQFNMSMLSTEGDIVQTDRMHAWLNLSEMLPPAIPRDDIELLHMPDWGETTMVPVSGDDIWTLHANDTLEIDLSTFGGGTFMINGPLDPVDVNPLGLDVVLRANGELDITWENDGDVDNPYFGGWRIYRKVDLRFAFPFSDETAFATATLGYEVTDVPASADSWRDPNAYPQGTCISYLVMSTDRSGLVDFSHGNVTGGVWNNVTQRMDVPEICVDASAPTTTVDDLRLTPLFDNETKMHSLELAWNWPELDEQGNLTWNLYRTAGPVPEVTYLEPLASGLSGEPGEAMIWVDEEGGMLEDLHIGHFYNYILVPVDEVGNADYLSRPENTRGIRMDEMYWDYHPEPPEPEPPAPPEFLFFGPSPWYGQLQDDLSDPHNSMAWMAAFAFIMVNLLMLPALINKIRGMKRRVDRAKRQAARNKQMMAADDLADDFDEFFG